MESQEDTGPEPEWVRRSKCGDKEAFGFLVKTYMRRAYYVAVGFLGSHDDALDASQEAFVKAFLAINTFDESKRFYTWYYRILKNHCLNMLRSKRLRPASFSEIFAEAEEPAGADVSPAEATERADLRKAVWDALWTLDFHDRELIVARDILGTSYGTLAELLEIPEGTVMSRLFHARRRLRGKLEGVL